MSTKVRLDHAVVQSGLAKDLKQALGMIMSGKVLVDDRPMTKAGTLISVQAVLRLKGQKPFVSRAGMKLHGALNRFGIDIRGYVALDLGAATGGFTDCLLKQGVQKVFAVDVGYGLLHWRLRRDPRVVVMERTHVLQLAPDQWDRAIDLVTMDLSFMSLRKVLGHIRPYLKRPSQVIAMVKPQFEAEKDEVPSGGVIRDSNLRMQIVQRVIDHAQGLGFKYRRGVDSVLPGPKGNVEHFLWLQWG